MAGYWPIFFSSLWTSTLSHSINTQKRTTCSHLDVMLGQQPFIWSAFICSRVLISLYFLVHVSVNTFVVHILKKVILFRTFVSGFLDAFFGETINKFRILFSDVSGLTLLVANLPPFYHMLLKVPMK